jgi:thiamine biosynthesis lipoprotein
MLFITPSSMPSLKHTSSSHVATRRTVPLMGTVVSIEVIGASPADAVIDRALNWFHRVEECCSRFDAQSELMQLVGRSGERVEVSALLFEVVQFAMAMAEETGGAFDPTVGHAMESRGFNREYTSGRAITTEVADDGRVSYRDVVLDGESRTITMRRPLVLDLGAVAKGFAIDLAARELQPFENFVIDAGGDLFVAGHNADGEPWSIGIRNPRIPGELLGTVRLRNQAICTSGDYERRTPDSSASHILDPRVDDSAASAASVTVIAPTAIMADALSTAAFVLGPGEGLGLLEKMGVDGLIVTPSSEQFATGGFSFGR